MGRIQVRSRLVPDPLMTDAEYLYQKNRERDRAEREGREPRLSIGKVWVKENALSRIGALCFIRKREAHHEAVAERFKSLYEARYGAGNPVMDPGRVQVDTSPIAHDSGMAAKIDRTADLKRAEDALGKAAFDRLVALLVLEIPAGEGMHWRKRSLSVDEVLSDIDQLAAIWGYAKRAA